MRTTFRKSSVLVLGLAVVAALGGLHTAGAAVHLTVNTHGLLPVNGGTTIEVGNIVKTAGNTVTVTVTQPAGGQVVKTQPVDTAAKFQSFAIEPVYTTQVGMYKVFAAEFTSANAPVVDAGQNYYFSVGKPASITVTTDKATYLPGQPCGALPGALKAIVIPCIIEDPVTISGTVLDAAGKPLVGHTVTITVSGGLLGSQVLTTTRPTDTGGNFHVSMTAGQTTIPGTYTATAKVLDAVIVSGDSTVNHYIDASSNYDILIPSP